MNNKKPDVMVLLSILFGLGVLISSITYGFGDQDKSVENQRAMGIMSTSSITAPSLAEK